VGRPQPSRRSSRLPHYSIDRGLTLAPAAAVCASAAGGFVPVFGKAGVFVPTPSPQIVAVPAGGNFTRFGKLRVRTRYGGGAFRIEILRDNGRELTKEGRRERSVPTAKSRPRRADGEISSSAGWVSRLTGAMTRSPRKSSSTAGKSSRSSWRERSTSANFPSAPAPAPRNTWLRVSFRPLRYRLLQKMTLREVPVLQGAVSLRASMSRPDLGFAA
jgi:hypothetical protein